MSGVILFINGKLGIDTIQSVSRNPNFYISAIVLGSKHRNKSNYFYEIESTKIVKNNQTPIFFFGENLFQELADSNVLKNTVLGISALFRHVFPKTFIDMVDFPIVNLHPSLLPIGRGADPIPWAIIDEQAVGVTIHKVDEGLDTGKVIAQRIIPTDLGKTAGDIYIVAMEQLLILLEELLKDWPHSYVETDQIGQPSLHRTSDLANLRHDILSDGSDLEKFVRIVQALTFNNGMGAKIRGRDGKVWNIKVIATQEEF